MVGGPTAPSARAKSAQGHGEANPQLASALGDRTDQRILDAAEQCMERLGLQRFSMSDVASQAGISRGAVYLHFADRATLVDAVLARVADRFVANSAVVVGRRHTLESQVAEAAVFIREHIGDELLTLRLPAQGESLMATIVTAQSERLVTGWVAFWQPYLAEAVERGEIRAGLDHRQAGEWIVRMMLTFAVLPSVTFDANDPAAVRAFVRAHLVAGMAA
jgi:AcrR family transcriptional regulator